MSSSHDFDMDAPRDPLAYLDSLQGSGIRPGLERMRELLVRAGSPEKAYRSVIIAGTNGKGSTASTLESILRKSGLRTGLYTSPHLVDIRERWLIDGRMIEPDALDSAIATLREAAAQCTFSPTYFEALTAVAFIAFRDAGCELVVLEVGMGGRLDATNVVRPAAALITTIGMDHTEFLGETIEAIAGEKAGVIHEGSIAVTSNSDARVLGVLERRATSVGGVLHVVRGETAAEDIVVETSRLRFRLITPLSEYAIESRLTGRHQVANVSLAVRGAELLSSRFPMITAEAITRGVSAARWRGRLERFEVGQRTLFVDGGHNPGAADEVAQFVESRLPRPRTLVFGMMSDKDVRATAARIFPLFDRVVLTRPDPERAMPLDELASIACELGVGAERLESPVDALRYALSGEPLVVVVFGSLYLAGAAVAYLDRIALPAAASSSSSDDPQASATSA